MCNKYGIYLEDEANIESHEYYYGAASLSHPVEWKNAHVARVMEMVHANVNNPSIVIWSLGNEAGPGKNFVAAYDALKKFDLSRPVQYERNNDIVDMGSNQYPSIGWVRGAVKGKYDISILSIFRNMLIRWVMPVVIWWITGMRWSLPISSVVALSGIG